MFVQVPLQTGYGSVRRVEVSLPYVAELIGDGEKYYLEPKRFEGTELRRARAPTVRFLVRQALRCQSAEELGRKLKRRYDRQYVGVKADIHKCHTRADA
jgi:hypothetical protein